MFNHMQNHPKLRFSLVHVYNFVIANFVWVTNEEEVINSLALKDLNDSLIIRIKNVQVAVTYHWLLGMEIKTLFTIIRRLIEPIGLTLLRKKIILIRYVMLPLEKSSLSSAWI